MRRDRGVALEIANPYFAVIASEAKQSIAQQVEKWIASLALAMTAKRLSGHCLRQTRSVCAREQRDEAIHGASQVENWIASLALAMTTMGRGLLRGACHRARVRATRWLATTQSKARAARTADVTAPA